jgi:hypothetical protein
MQLPSSEDRRHFGEAWGKPNIFYFGFEASIPPTAASPG